MKILAIRGQNLASLEGEFEIDFTVEPLKSAGIFAITGSTGAGKSTILDALCLALFDQTPRTNIGESAFVQDVQDKLINQKDSRNILRRGSGEGYAEVDFISLGGEKFRSKWMVKRARGKYDGAMQSSEIRLINLDTNLELAGRKTEILPQISNLLGLTYDQFTRAVLLAQGDFSAFLKAKQTEKADLLEKLTGTDIYSRISMSIYEHSKNEDRELQTLLDRINEIELLSDSDLLAIVEEKQGLSKHIEKYKLNLEELNEKVKWVIQNQVLTNAVIQANSSMELIQQKIGNFRLRYDFLQKIEKAQEIRDVFMRLKNSQEKEKAQSLSMVKNTEDFQNNEPKLAEILSLIEICTAKVEKLENSSIYKEIIPRMKLVEEWIHNVHNVTMQGRASGQKIIEIEKELKNNNSQQTLYKERLEKLKLMLTAEIANLRSKLEDGQPCPVCGSLHHPIQGNDVVESMEEQALNASKKDLSQKIEIISDLIDKQKFEYERLQLFVEESRLKYSQIVNQLDSILFIFPNWKESLAQGNLWKRINDEVSQAQNELKTTQERLAKYLKDKEILIGQQEKIKGMLEQIQIEYAGIKKDIDHLQKHLNQWVLEKGGGLTIEELSQFFSKDATWVQQEREELQLIKKEEVSAIATLKERKTNLEIHHQSSFKVDVECQKSLDLLAKEQTMQLEKLNKRMLEIDVLIEGQTKENQKLKVLEKERTEKVVITENWKKLNDMLGSASGSKFKEIAQGYTLDILLAFSNKHLQYLSPRYQLQRIMDSLSLQVVDLHMLGEVRTVHSLSGGESFLISLSLALGLSSLSSNKMNVESLFIDEGFGSLDINTLRIAMDALERLQTQGRKIGVISHVAEMTERISTQVRVIKMSNGKSRVDVV